MTRLDQVHGRDFEYCFRPAHGGWPHRATVDHKKGPDVPLDQNLLRRLFGDRDLPGLRIVLVCPVTATAVRQGPESGTGPAWIAYLCPAHTLALSAWPGPLTHSAGLHLPCGTVLDFRAPEELLRSHADLWLSKLSGLSPEVSDGDWSDVLGQAYEVLSARLDEGDKGDGVEGGGLSGIVTMAGMAHRSAVAGNLFQAALSLCLAETLALRF